MRKTYTVPSLVLCGGAVADTKSGDGSNVELTGQINPFRKPPNGFGGLGFNL